MKYLSLFSGIEAASVAWGPLGWKPVAFSEIEPFPRAVLAHHFPEVENLGDITKLTKERLHALAADGVALVVGGCPCQSFSLAGLRKGLDDPRGNLVLEYLRVVAEVRPRWLVFENVPGILSSTTNDAEDPTPPDIDLDGDYGPEDGAEVVEEDEVQCQETSAFACLLAGLSELGYGVAWGVLDAQYFHLAQRRERVFVVGCLGDGARARAVLLERSCLSGAPPPRRTKGQGVARSLDTGAGGCSAKEQQRTFVGDNGEPLNPLVPDISKALAAPRSGAGGSYRGDAEVETFIPEVAHSLRADGFDGSEDGTGRGTPLIPSVVGALGEIGGNARPGDTPDGAAAGYLVPVVVGTLGVGSGGSVGHQYRQAGNEDCVVATVYENHAQDSRIKEVQVCPQINAKAGTGGNNLPLVAFSQNQREEVRDLGDLAAAVKGPGTHEATLVATPDARVFRKGKRAQSEDDDETWVEEDVANTLNCFDVGDVRATEIVVEPDPIVFQERGRESGRNIELQGDGIVPALRSSVGGGSSGHHTKIVLPDAQAVDLYNQTLDPGAHAPLRTAQGHGAPAVMGFTPNDNGEDAGEELSPTVRSGSGGGQMSPGVAQPAMRVRRLTPRECERLQGFPDDWTMVPIRKLKHRKKCPLFDADNNLHIVGADYEPQCKCHVRTVPAEKCPDGPRYKAIGNSMATTVMSWIGQRIQVIEDFDKEIAHE